MSEGDCDLASPACSNDLMQHVLEMYRGNYGGSCTGARKIQSRREKNWGFHMRVLSAPVVRGADCLGNRVSHGHVPGK